MSGTDGSHTHPLGVDASGLSAHSTAIEDTDGGPPTVGASIAGGWLGGYRLLRKIGAGGAGTVWEAADGGGRRVALKMLHPSLAESEEARKRLLREARLVNRIDSRGVVGVIDVEADASTPFVVTELVEGQTLDIVVSNQPLPITELAQLAIDLADILDSVHAAEVAHRDLKPSNIVMSPDGPVLIDFGIAQSARDSRLTTPGSVAGTPGYVAPEILRDADSASSQQWRDGDWFAWAAVLLSAATGRPPFGTGAPDAILHRLFSGDPDTRGLAPVIARAFKLALSAEPSLRADADSLIQTLQGEDLGFLEGTTQLLPEAPEESTHVLGTHLVPMNDAGIPQATDAQLAPHQTWDEVLIPTEYHYRFPHAPPAPTLSVLFLAFIGWLPGAFGLTWALAAPAVLLCAQTGGRMEHALAARRERFGGPRPSDGAVTALSLPWSLMVSAMVLLPSIVVGATVFFVILSLATGIALGTAGDPIDFSPLWQWLLGQGDHAPEAWQLGLAWSLAAVSAWAMPTSRWARTGMARLFSWVAPTVVLRWVWGVILATGLTLLVAI